MRSVHLRIGDLRRKKEMTQQELASQVGVSFQTISKWEKGNVMPDITYLPMLAEFFGVSIDQLMGMVPLEGEQYIPETTGTGQFWDNKLEYLLRTLKNAWNNDYVQFLIEKVWKIEMPVKVLDCGCGYGFLGLLLMPLLPKGSVYTGIDLGEKLLEKGRVLVEEAGIEANLIHKDVYEQSREKKEQTVQFFMTHGMSRKEAIEYLNRNEEIAEYFREYLGYQNPQEAMENYLKNYLTMDGQFRNFAKEFSQVMDFCLLSNDVWE